jgi:hypothetical protein
MLWPRFAIAAFLLALVGSASPQDVDRQAYAREHVRFLVLQLDQWNKEFPQQFYAALACRLWIRASCPKRPRRALGSLANPSRLAALSGANDVLTNVEFRNQLQKAIESSKEFNQAMSIQRFPRLYKAVGTSCTGPR